VNASVPELVIEGGPSPRLTPALRELWAYRATVLAFAERQARLKYKQAFLGIGWAIIQPLTFMGIFTLTIGRLGKVTGDGVPYAAFALATLGPWTFLQTGITFGANSLVTDASLVRKVYFPREVPVLGAIVATLVDLGISLILFMIIGPFIGAHVTAWWLFGIILGIPLTVLAGGVALALSSLTVYYRDFRHALPILLQLWLFASPVAYPLSVVPGKWRSAYIAINPAVGIIDSFRRTMAVGIAPDWNLLLESVVGSIVVAWAGYRIFKRLERNFAEVI
jgi:ABC-type polysaccharide/polyol phosphate export permease